MPREKEAYRDNLERILTHFDGKEVLGLQEVIDYTSLSKEALLASDLPLKQTTPPRNNHGGKYFISSATLARWLS